MRSENNANFLHFHKHLNNSKLEYCHCWGIISRYTLVETRKNAIWLLCIVLYLPFRSLSATITNVWAHVMECNFRLLDLADFLPEGELRSGGNAVPVYKWPKCCVKNSEKYKFFLAAMNVRTYSPTTDDGFLRMKRIDLNFSCSTSEYSSLLVSCSRSVEVQSNSMVFSPNFRIDGRC